MDTPDTTTAAILALVVELRTTYQDHAASALEALVRERDRLREENAMTPPSYRRAVAVIEERDTLRAEVERLKAEAEKWEHHTEEAMMSLNAATARAEATFRAGQDRVLHLMDEMGETTDPALHGWADVVRERLGRGEGARS